MYDYDEENDWFLADKTWEEYYNEGFENEPMFWVYYRGTSNGAYIRAASHNAAKWIYAKGEGLASITYLQSKKA